MHPTAGSDSHRPLDEPIITTRAEVQRQVREEVDAAFSAASHPRRAGRAIASIATVTAIVWLILALVAVSVGLIALR